MTDHLASVLAQVAQVLAAENDTLSVLKRACELAVEVVDPCDHADVMVLTRGNVSVPGASDWVGPRIVSIETELDEGPCLEAAHTGAIVPIEDHEQETRFPRFAAKCIEATPVRSSVGLPLTVAGRTLGAIDLYADRPNAFDEGDVGAGALFATHVGIAVAAARARENFEVALASRDLIAQAKGILMARNDLSSDAAFEMLRDASQRLNIKLRVAAQNVVDDLGRA